MRSPVRSRSYGIRFNITPLIDIVFLLVIFFLVASHFASNEAADPVDLPFATQTIDEEEPLHRTMITVRSDGTLLVGGREVTLDEIETMLAEGAAEHPDTYAVQIRADREASYADVEPLLMACPKFGITKVGFKTLQRRE